MRWLSTRKVYNSSDVIITYETRNSWVHRVLRVKPRRTEFIGSGTVWRRLPKWKRCSLGYEMMLSDRYDQWMHDTRGQG